MAINTSTRLHQVKAHLLNYISQNQLKRNDQLPSEAAIAKTLGVSRNTLREAYISLENEGVIVRRHGIGTFVAHPPVIRDSLNEFSPFAQLIQDSGYKPNFQTLSMGFVLASIEVNDALNTLPSTELRCIKRLVLADQQPVIYVEDYFRIIFPQQLKKQL
jgi:GntR family transcriptional regulator